MKKIFESFREINESNQDSSIFTPKSFDIFINNIKKTLNFSLIEWLKYKASDSTYEILLDKKDNRVVISKDVIYSKRDMISYIIVNLKDLTIKITYSYPIYRQHGELFGKVTKSDVDELFNFVKTQQKTKIFESFLGKVNESVASVVEIVDRKNIYLRNRNSDIIGLFEHSGARSSTYDLIAPTDFDKKLLRGVIISPTEHVFRTQTEIMKITSSQPFVKIDFERGLVYFLEDTETITFERRGSKLTFMVIEDEYFKTIATGKSNPIYKVLLDSNPLSHKSKKQAITFLQKITHNVAPSKYREKWMGRDLVLNAIKNEGIEVTVVDSKLTPEDRSKLRAAYMTWYFEIPFINDKLQQEVIKGHITAHSAGSVEDTLDAHDITIQYY